MVLFAVVVVLVEFLIGILEVLIALILLFVACPVHRLDKGSVEVLEVNLAASMLTAFVVLEMFVVDVVVLPDSVAVG